MIAVLSLLAVLPIVESQFLSGFGEGFGGFRGPLGGLFNSPSQFYGNGDRSYFVRGRLLCGITGAQGASVSLWENTGGNQPTIYESSMVDASGIFNIRAQIPSGGNWNSGGSRGDGYLVLTINHNCDGNRQMSIALPPNYFNQGIVQMKTFDIGTLNLEARYSGEQNNAFNGVGGNRAFGGRGGGGFGAGQSHGGFGGAPQPI